MAVVIPYGDAQAHGSLGDSISFRRHRARVVLQKKPHSRVPGTPGQKAQRTKFKGGWKDYHSLSLWTLEYLKEKAIKEQTTPSNYYLSQYLADAVPSNIKHSGIKKITDLDLPEKVGDESDDLLFRFLARTDAGPSDQDLGHILDNENTFVAGATASAYDRAVLKIERTQPSGLLIPFDYPILIWWQNFSDVDKINIIRLPELLLPLPFTEAPITTVKEINWTHIPNPVLPAGEDTTLYPMAKDPADELWKEFGHRLCTGGYHYDYPNTWDPILGMHIKFTYMGVSAYTSPENWKLTLEWIDSVEGTVQKDLYFPAFQLTNLQSLRFYISTDLSLYYDEDLTDLAKDNRPKTKELFIAQDFSLYYDKEMTQLANSPHFQPD